MSGSLVLPLALNRLVQGVILGDSSFGVVQGNILFQHPYLTRALVCLEVGALLTVSVGFLFLAWRISWGVQQFIATCRQRQKTEARLVEMFRDYVEVQRATSEQLWSASAALSPC